MADLRLDERTPLRHRADPGRHGALDGDPGIILDPSPGFAVTLLIARKGQISDTRRAAASHVVTLPTTPKFIMANGFSVLWAGPEQWLLVAEPHAQGQAERLAALCAPTCMVIDQTDARAMIVVSGVAARAMLAKGFAIDLHPRAFKAGDVALTIAAGMSAQIWQIDEAPRYGLAVARSYAESFWHWLNEASAEFGYVVKG